MLGNSAFNTAMDALLEDDAFVGTNSNDDSVGKKSDDASIVTLASPCGTLLSWPGTAVLF